MTAASVIWSIWTCLLAQRLRDSDGVSVDIVDRVLIRRRWAAIRVDDPLRGSPAAPGAAAAPPHYTQAQLLCAADPS
jgi:hypothetical protein